MNLKINQQKLSQLKHKVKTNWGKKTNTNNKNNKNREHLRVWGTISNGLIWMLLEHQKEKEERTIEISEGIMAEYFSKISNNNKHKSKKIRESQVRKNGEKIYLIILHSNC